jgi:hypothetical protein
VRDELLRRLAPDLARLKALVGVDAEACGWTTPAPETASYGEAARPASRSMSS